MTLTRTHQPNAPLGLMELEQIFREVDPRVVLLPPRILRRVIKHDRLMTSLGLQVPHRKTYLLDAEVAGQVLARDELGLDPETEVALSGPLILIERPEPSKLARLPRPLALRKYWRLLFHARVDLALEERRRAGRLSDELVRARILRIGPTVFDEARAVLRLEDFLLPPRDQWIVYREFASVYLELKYFAARLLPAYFPSIHDQAHVDEVLAADLDALAVFEDTFLPGAAVPEADPAAGLDPDLAPNGMRPPPHSAASPQQSATRSSPRVLQRLRNRADRAEARGNLARAVMLRSRAARLTSSSSPDAAQALDALSGLVTRLIAALGLPADSAPAWLAALTPLTETASEGQWANEGRLLFDLQRACLDHERPVFTVDLVEWLLSAFRRPIKRPLPVQADTLAVKHIRSAAYRVRFARLADFDRDRLDSLLSHALHLTQERLRERTRPLLAESLEQTDLVPQNVPERVAFAKIVEELLDQVVDRGYLTMGHLRDAVARNNLKLPDLASPGEFFQGDRLLRADHQLSYALDGVYRRGEVYLRWLQRFSSLGFGTPPGRFLTNYIVLPFGGAFVVLKGIDSLVAGIIHLFTPAPSPSETLASVPASTIDSADTEEAEIAETAAPPPTLNPSTSASLSAEIPTQLFPEASTESSSSTSTLAKSTPEQDTLANAEQEMEDLLVGEDVSTPGATVPEAEPYYAITTVPADPGHHDKNMVHVVPPDILPWATLVGGILLMGLLHAPRFRTLVLELLRTFRRGLRLVFIEAPQWLLQNPWVRRVLETRTFQFLWRMVVKPFVPAAAGWAWMRLVGVPPEAARAGALGLFLGVGLFLSLRIGRDLEEITSDWIVRTWRVIRVNILVGLYQAIVDLFAEFVELVDRLLYTVDEWLRFRSGESRFSYLAKALLGAIWFYIAYTVRFIVNLLVEPQINPIKHFPVVTVSHKVMAPYLFVLLYVGLKDQVGEREAGLIYFFVQLLLPGVFGFLVWELKENFRLYQANQPDRLQRVAIGHHGESMLRLLKPGLHSGTVPKLFTRLRRVERQALIRGLPRRLMVQKLNDQLHHVEESVQRFIERELICLWRQTLALRSRTFQVVSVELCSNRIRAEVACPELNLEPAELRFEFRSGWMLAGLGKTGWIDQLDQVERRVLEASLAGLYQLAATDLVLQDLEYDLPVPARELEFNEQGLLFWIGDRLQTEATYSLTDRPRLLPHITGPPPEHPLPVLEADRLLLKLAPISWIAWIATWEAERSGQAPPQPYLPGFSLLPPPHPVASP